MDLVELKKLKISELTNMAKDFHIEGASGMRRQDLIFSLANSGSSWLTFSTFKRAKYLSVSLGGRI